MTSFEPIIVCGDYKGDLHGIVRVLNQWRFDAEGDIKFEVRDGAIYSTRIGLDPCADPWRLNEDPDDGEPEWISDETILQNILPLLESGTLELVSVDHQRDCNAFVVRLVIRANGSVQRRTQFLARAKVTKAAGQIQPFQAATLRYCHDCGARVGEMHKIGCDVELCPQCGAQALCCDCGEFDPNDPRRQPWDGKSSGTADCERLASLSVATVPALTSTGCSPNAAGTRTHSGGSTSRPERSQLS